MSPSRTAAGDGGGAGVEPGERVGRGTERAEQRAQIRVGEPGGGTAAGVGRRRVRPARDAETIGVGFVLGVLPGGPKPGVIVVRVGETAVRGHGGVSPSR